MKHHEKILKAAEKMRMQAEKGHEDIKRHIEMATKSHEKEGKHLEKAKKVAGRPKKK